MATKDAPQNRPASPEQAPNPARSYERAHPDDEAGMGRLDNDTATPTDRADQINQTVRNRQDGKRQINAHDDPGGTGGGGQPLNQPDLSEPDRDRDA
jgi:hypothetical protein